MENEKMILALYDFASKQKYIFSSPKIKEISGASDLLTNAYKKMTEDLKAGAKIEGRNYRCANNSDGNFSFDAFKNGNDDATVLYDGGGSLMVLYRNMEAYLTANKHMSLFVLKQYPGLSLIAAHTECTGVFDPQEGGGDRSRLYAANAVRKNLTPSVPMEAVTPMTQIDPLSFHPVVWKKKENDELLSLSADRRAKRDANTAEKQKEDSELNKELIAAIHIDGNSMGQKLKKCKAGSYDDGVNKLRQFSKCVNEAYIEVPQKAIREKINDCRWVITGGDDITLICRAKDARRVVLSYFDALNKTTPINGSRNYACAGIAVAHAKTPFAALYEIAEAACDSAKKKSRGTPGNYVDYYYCHGGIVDDFDTLRENQQGHVTGRPYSVDEFKSFDSRIVPILLKVGRANVKALGNAAQVSKDSYDLECERVGAYLARCGKSDDSEGDKQYLRDNRAIVYDAAEFYDLWFAKENDRGEGAKA